MRQSIPIVVALLLFGGCHKHLVRGVSGSDDEELDRLSAQLEEIKSRVQAHEPTCSEWCPLAKKVCDISRSTCDIAARNPERADIQKRCPGTQEDCAKFTDSCTSCGKL